MPQAGIDHAPLALKLMTGVGAQADDALWALRLMTRVGAQADDAL